MSDAPESRLPAVDVSSADGVATIELYNPSKRNAITPAMWSELLVALDAAERDDEIRVVMIRGAGEHFSAGLDLGDLLPGYLGQSNAIADVNRMLDHAVRAGTRISQLRKPVVAEVRGACVGAGLLLFLACDLSVVADDVAFRLPAAAIGAGLFGPILASQLGGRRAKSLLLSPKGLRLDAAAALELGLASQVTSPDEVRGAAAEFARSLAGLPGGWLQIQKMSVDHVAGGVSIPEALRIGAYFDAVAHASTFARDAARELSERFRQE